MGAKMAGDEQALAELKALSPEAKTWLCHHLGNALNGITGPLQLIQAGHPDIKKCTELALQSAWHIVDDLHLAGIRNTRR